jgi:hypothetical protein
MGMGETYQALKPVMQEIILFREGQCRDVVGQVKHLPIRKEQAAMITRTAYPGVVFSMLDHKNYQDIIWKLLYPEASRPFKMDEEA